MPQLDQTGPNGMGPATGRGKGECASGRGYGRGFGFGRRNGGGFCRGFYNPSKQEEKENLLQELGDAKEYIKSMEARLEELSNENK